MKRIVAPLSLVLVFLLCSAVYSQSNKPLKPVVEIITVSGFRTEGGLANLVDCQAIREREGEVTQFTTSNFIADGDVVELGANGYVELLLNPGS